MVGGTRNLSMLISDGKTPFRALLYFIISLFLLAYFELHDPFVRAGYLMVESLNLHLLAWVSAILVP